MLACCCAAEDAGGIAHIVAADGIDAEDSVLHVVSGAVQGNPGAAAEPASGASAGAPPKEEARASDVAGAPATAEEAINNGRFKATVARSPSASFGWRLDCVDDSAIFVFDVPDNPSTPVSMYNASAPAHQRLVNGDYIVEVNGSTVVQEMVDAIEKNDKLEITVQRPSFSKVVVKKDGPLGLELKYWKAGTSVVVGDIRDGAVRTQNVDLRVGDRLLGVNGTDGSVTVLLSAVKDCDSLEFEISRCPPAP